MYQMCILAGGVCCFLVYVLGFLLSLERLTLLYLDYFQTYVIFPEVGLHIYSLHNTKHAAQKPYSCLGKIYFVGGGVGLIGIGVLTMVIATSAARRREAPIAEQYK